MPMTADAAHEWAGFDPATDSATYTAPRPPTRHGSRNHTGAEEG